MVQINQRSMMVQINFMHDLTLERRDGLINFIKVSISPSIQPFTITPSKLFDVSIVLPFFAIASIVV